MSNPSSAIDRFFDEGEASNTPASASEIQRPSRKPLLDSTIDSIRDALLTGIIPAGERLDEYALSKELDVSRATVREAIRQLEQQGLLNRIPFKGTFARELSHRELEEITALRGVLEDYAVEHIILHGTEEDLAALSAKVDHMERLSVDTNFEETLRVHLDFHRTLCQLSGNSFLYEAWSNLTLHVLRILRMSQRFYAEHERENTLAKAHRHIIEVMTQGDVQLAREAIRAHVTTPGISELLVDADNE